MGKYVAAIAVSILCLTMTSVADSDVMVSFGFNIPEKNALDDALLGQELSAGFGIMFDAGLRFKLNDHVYITPSVGVIENIVEGRDLLLNLLVMARVKGCYQFTKAPSVYVGGEVNMNMPVSSDDDYDLDSGGMGYGAFIGYAFWSPRSVAMSLEAGYQEIPVEVSTDWGFEDEDNMGGGFVRVVTAF